MLYAIVAMQKEADTLLCQASVRKQTFEFGKSVWEGEAFGRAFTLLVSGVGKANAAAASMLALSHGAKCLLNFGVAGGITPRAKIGALFQIERTVQYDFDLSQINGTPIGTLDDRSSPFLPVSARKNDFLKATLATGDRFVNGNAEQGLFRQLGADLREMEGAAIAQVCGDAGIPCLLFKSVSDNIGENSVREYQENLKIALHVLRENMPKIWEEAFYEYDSVV